MVVLGSVWSFWGGLGRSRAVLGRPLVAATPRVLLGSIFESPWRPKVDFWIALGDQEGAKTEPKDDQKAILKSMQKTSAC